MNEDENVIWRGMDARLERLEDVVQEIDATLRGDRRRKIIGLLQEWDRHDSELTKLKAVVLGDAAGSKGMYHDVDVLMGRRKYDSQSREIRWKVWGSIIAVAMTQAVIILLNLDKIKANLPKYHPSPLEQKIDQARHPKSPKKIYKVRLVPSKTISEDIKDSSPN